VSISCYDLIAVYRRVSAHAADSPWDGVNALDAVVSAYNNISMLRQQIHPTERIHGAILQAPTVTNAIPELTRVKYTIRSPTTERTKALGARVRKCLEAGALATGCRIELEETAVYADLVINPPLCKAFQEYMGDQGDRVWGCDETPISASTDQGNVSQIMPALHALIGIPVEDGARNHTRQFTFAVGTEEAHTKAVTTGKAMAMTGWKVLVDDDFYEEGKTAFKPGKRV
jgi:metal-dependent amidase/aminoacylase/carboxypeptidase family protein